MVRRMNEAFSDEHHAAMKVKKQEKAEELGLKKMSWEKYFLHITGVRPWQK